MAIKIDYRRLRDPDDFLFYNHPRLKHDHVLIVDTQQQSVGNHDDLVLAMLRWTTDQFGRRGDRPSRQWNYLAARLRLLMCFREYEQALAFKLRWAGTDKP